MRREELTKLTVNNIEDRGCVLVVHIPDSKTHQERTFTITHQDYIQLYRKYYALRPPKATSQRFFLRYTRGKCANQVVGIHKIGEIPSIVAKFLKLSDVKMYTGHCFRRSSATLLADSGADITEIKRHGSWKSSTVAENYIENSIEQKNKTCNKILNFHKEKKDSTSLAPNSLPTSFKMLNETNCASTNATASSFGVNVNNASGSTFNFYFNN